MEAQNFNDTKAKFTQHTEETSRIMSALQSLAIGKELSNEEIKTIREFESVQEYLDLPLNDPAEDKIKKIFVAAVVAAHQKGILKLPEGYDNAESIASIVDEGLTRIKAAYQVAEGKVNPIDAEEAVNDRQAIRTAAITDLVVKRLVEKANEYVAKAEEAALSVSDRLVALGLGRLTDIVCAAAVRAYPPAAVVVPYVKQFVHVVTPKAQKAVKKGIKMAADFARNAINKTANKVKSFAKKSLAKLLA